MSVYYINTSVSVHYMNTLVIVHYMNTLVSVHNMLDEHFVSVQVSGCPSPV